MSEEKKKLFQIVKNNILFKIPLLIPLLNCAVISLSVIAAVSLQF